MIVKKDGTIYFTDGFGGLRLREKDPKREIDGTASTWSSNGKVTRVINDIPNTNGVAFSPDEKTFYANGSRDRFIKAYDVNADGTLENGRMLIDSTAIRCPASPTACGST